MDPIESSVERITLSFEDAAKADDLERRLSEGDPSLEIMTLSEFVASHGGDRD